MPFEGPAAIADWARRGGHSLTVTGLFHGTPLPAHDEFDLLVVMGGPMSVHDEREYPWLKREKRLIDEALRAAKGVLGVCLGAQLLADVLGARVYRSGEKEIGWHPVRAVRNRPDAASPWAATLPDSFLAFHWHGETFDLPSGAVHLAETDVCPHQAFAIGSQVLALQFHLEVTPESVGELATHCAGDLDGGRHVQSGGELLGSPPKFREAESLLFGLLDQFQV